MNLRNVADDKLVPQMKSFVKIENEALTAILYHFKEVERRRLFSAYGYKSLFDFGVRELGYAEGDCYRRIHAMRLLKDFPEVEDKINSGELSLTNMSIAQSHFKKEAKLGHALTNTEKLEVLQKVSNISSRTAEKVVLSLSSSPQPHKPDRIKHMSEDTLELTYTGPTALEMKIEKLKGLLAHRHPDISLGELMDKLCDLGLTIWDPAKTSAQKKTRVMKTSAAQVRRDVFAQAQNACENCGSYYAPQTDHIIPKAKGGSSDRDNFRLLCRSCNQRAAIEKLGMLKMEKYLNDRL